MASTNNVRRPGLYLIRNRILLSLLFATGVSLALIGCGGGGNTSSTNASRASAITVFPFSANVLQGGQQAFTASLGSSTVPVTWSVQENSGGTITDSGLYTAPAAAGTYHIVATSTSVSAGVATVIVPQVSVQINPTAARVGLGTTQAFTASAAGTVNRGLTWKVQEGGAGGTVSDIGIYTAPSGSGVFHVIATSVADATKSASAEVSVAPIVVAVRPSSDVLGPLGVRAFSADLTASSLAGVLWSLQEGSIAGLIDDVGDYTAPTMQLGTFHVTASSNADLSKKGTASVDVVSAGFRPTGALNSARESQTASLLSDGRVLVVGGEAEDTGLCGPAPAPAASSELYDPVTGTFMRGSNLVTARSQHTATTLNDGRILIAGGSNNAISAELFDPANGSFKMTASPMILARISHTATRLLNGKVLITGGKAAVNGTDSATAEIYDPVSDAFVATGSMTQTRSSHSATLLPSGKVLITGGVGLKIAEIYDPLTGTFTAIGSMAQARARATATLLADKSKVLVTGGFDAANLTLATTEFYDIATGQFVSGPMLIVPRYFHTATLLADGRIVLAGGTSDKSLYTTEVFDPTTGTITQSGSLGTPRNGHTATLLQDGSTILVTGGGRDAVPLASSEIFH